MSTLSLSPLRFSAQEITAVVELYASNPEYCRAADEYDPDDVRPDQVESDLREESGTDGCEVLLARDEQNTVIGLISLLHQHPKDGHPWIGMLIAHGAMQRRGLGRQLAASIEDRFRAASQDDLSLVFNLGRSPDPLILVRSRDSRTAVLHASRCRATSREGTAAGEESRP
ncbi:GNAT family N-acetyltransferase [Streptomyces mirabilis]|uniref:GNAT family N-acetyltransferase n=1 Tax=Streptomyces mirabilis TaxID=68239 RepID=UPI002E32CD65|nr:GNAT family N-acetyltransferase [Streptomyces mirabilis]